MNTNINQGILKTKMNNMDHIKNLGANSGSLEGLAIPAPHVAPIVLLNIIL